MLTSVILLPLFLYAIFSDHFYYAALLFLVLLVTGFGIFEFFSMQKNRDGRYATPVAFPVTMGALINVLFYSHLISVPDRFVADPQSLLYLLLFFLLVATFFYQVFFRPIPGAVKNVSLVLFAVVYVAIPLSLVFGLRSLGDQGIQAILVAAASSFLADTGAYFSGTFIGKHSANIKVSPNKSIEGYVGGILFNILGTVLLIYLFDFLFDRNFFSITEGVFLGFVLGIAGQIGDLIESAVKRDWGVKDSGFLIPGHGGILDLVDATLINIPLIWFYVSNF